MTLLLFLTGLTTHASTGTPVVTQYFTVSGSQVWDKFPVTSVVSSYAAITRETE